MSEPEYYICIERLDTEQKAFVGVVKGPIAKLVETTVLEHVRVLDAGKRLSARQERRAYHRAR